MANNLLKVDFECDFKFNKYKNVLRKLQHFVSYCATVGIHQSEGKTLMPHYYTSGKKSRKTGDLIKHMTGRSHMMTLIKVAYQNEFGADIKIPPRYRVITEKKTKTLHYKHSRVIKGKIVKRTDFNRAGEIGYLLRDKSGEHFVMYKRVGQYIHIPKRSFIRDTANHPQPRVSIFCSEALYHMINGDKSVVNTVRDIANVVKFAMRNKMRATMPNRKETIEAKGRNSPLIDEKDRLYKAINYKIYKNVQMADSNGAKTFNKQLIKHVDKLLASAIQYEKGIYSEKQVYKVFEYKGVNPNWGLKVVK